MNAVIKISSPETRESWEIPILFEDAHLLALNKPSRLLTSPDRYDPDRPNLMKLLHRDIARGAPWSRERQLGYLANAHRLDFEITGVILLAKEKPVLIALANQFGANKPIKTYIGLVQGNPAQAQFEVNASLAPHPVRFQQMRRDEKHGKHARTEFALLEKFKGFALLQCRPLTARTHQIRAHLQIARLPIAGDSMYGGRPLYLSQLKSRYRLKPGRVERPLIGIAALHAESLSLAHPVTGAVLTLTAPWPKDLSVAVKYLRRFAV
ncbi:MAG: RluA family pseudouridine synthase [Candidatus Omnitrophica bacterium]|nr:RluA family pseudouridine synthase [Candidatus Omnitrophota bacterium]